MVGEDDSVTHSNGQSRSKRSAHNAAASSHSPQKQQQQQQQLLRKRTHIPPELRMLKVEVQSLNGQYVPLEPNALEPTCFETAFFEGKAMLLVRTNPIEPHLECFFAGRK